MTKCRHGSRRELEDKGSVRKVGPKKKREKNKKREKRKKERKEKKNDGKWEKEKTISTSTYPYPLIFNQSARPQLVLNNNTRRGKHEGKMARAPQNYRTPK